MILVDFSNVEKIWAEMSFKILTFLINITKMVFSFQMSSYDILKEHQFNGFCNILKISGQPMNNPDRKLIEKSFRKLALKTHPDKVIMHFYLLRLMINFKHNIIF